MTYLFFNIKPHSNHIVIKCIEKTEKEEHILDEPLECSPNKVGDEKYIHDLSDILYIRFYKCTISDSFLMSNKILPIMYGSIAYQDKIMGGILANLFVEFKIEDEVKSEKQLINSPLNGSYRITLKPNIGISGVEKEFQKCVEQPLP